jgi:DNA-damage-inducible protein J
VGKLFAIYSRWHIFWLDNISIEIQNDLQAFWDLIAMNIPTSMIHVRVDDETKDQAADALAAMGLSMSDAVRLFLRRVVIDQAFPLELKVPNAETRAAIAESRRLMSTRRARFSSPESLLEDLEKKRNK